MKLARLNGFVFLLAISTCASAIDATSTDDAFEKACVQSDVVTMAALVKAGANPNGVGSHRGSPLWVAIKSDDASLVQLLLAKGADPNISSNPAIGCGPLWSAFDTNLSILGSLLAAGANPNCVWADKSGAGDQSLTTPLIAAASLKALRMGGRRLAWTDKPVRKDTPQPADVIRLLLKYGANPNTRSYFGDNALYAAIDADDVAAASALIDGGLDINATIDHSTPGEVNPWKLGQTALMHALWRYDSSNMQAGKRMLGMLLEKGANPNVAPLGRFIDDCGQGTPPCTFSGETPLSYVARLGYKDFAQLLLEHGAKPDGVRADGAKPAEIAMQAGHMQTAALITRYENRLILPASASSPQQ
jgi:ankyrin repeat protein